MSTKDLTTKSFFLVSKFNTVVKVLPRSPSTALCKRLQIFPKSDKSGSLDQVFLFIFHFILPGEKGKNIVLDERFVEIDNLMIVVGDFFRVIIISVVWEGVKYSARLRCGGIYIG